MRLYRSRVGLLLVCFTIISGCASATKIVPNLGHSSFPIIDAHVHTQFTGKVNHLSGIAVTQENFLKEKNANGVVGAIALTRSYDEGYFNLSRDHVIHCVGLRDKKPDTKKIEEGLKAGRYSCIKIYLGYVYQYATDPNYEPVYKIAEKYSIPIIFHTGDTYDKDGLIKYSDPLGIDEVAVKHRKVNFVIAHLGNPWVNTAAEIVYKNENVYADVSAFLTGDLSREKPELVEAQLSGPIRWAYGYIGDSRKLMYGTDWPLVHMRGYIEAVKKAIPKEHWHDVFYNNAQRVFKIPGLETSIPRVQ